MSILELIKESLPKLRQNGLRLRSIFIKLRLEKRFDGMSDIALFNSLVISMADLGLPYSKREIYSVFKIIDKTDYELQDRNTLIGQLVKSASQKSVFSLLS